MNLSMNELLIYLAAAAVGYFLRNILPKPTPINPTPINPTPINPNLDSLIDIIRQLLAQLKIFGEEARIARSNVPARTIENKNS